MYEGGEVRGEVMGIKFVTVKCEHGDGGGCGARWMSDIGRFPVDLTGIEMRMRCSNCGDDFLHVIEVESDGLMDVDLGVEV